MDLTNILAQLPQLSVEDRRTIKQRLVALETLESPSKIGAFAEDPRKPLKMGVSEDPQNGRFSPKSLENNDILGAICDFMAFSGVETPHFGVLQRLSNKAFEDKIPAIASYLGSSDLTKLQRRAILFVGVQLLYDNLCEMGIAVTSRTLMSHIHRLPACLNRAFPGYAKMGHLRFIVRKKHG